LPARPLDFEPISFYVAAESKGQHQLTLRKITRTASHHTRLPIIARLKMNHGSNAVTIRLGPNKLNAQAVIRSALVTDELCRTSDRWQDDIERAIGVDVGIGHATRNTRTREVCPHLGCDFRKFACSQIAEQMRRLRVMNTFLNGFDLIFYVSVGHEDI